MTATIDTAASADYQPSGRGSARPTGRTRTGSNARVLCQVCGRRLVPLADGTSRNHVPRRGAEDYCGGSRHRLARWPVGQKLRHHGGSVWEVAEDRDSSTRWGDYLIRCVVGSRSYSDPTKWLEAPGKAMVAHGEYLHRDGWKPLPRDLMAALEASLKAVAA